MNIDDKELAGLTDAERAALEDYDINEIPEAADESDSKADTDAADDGAAGDEADAGETAKEANDTDEAENLTDPASQSFSVPTGDLAEITAQLDKLRAAQEELEADYESGDSELTFAEFKAKQRELNGAILDLNAEKAEVQAIQKMNAAYQQQWWANEIKSFKREAAREGVDYDADPKLAAEWDKAVRYLGNDPDNADKDAGWFLKEGHEMVKARFRLGKAEIPSQQSRLSKVDEALAQRRQKAGDPPKTLASLPQAGIETEGQSEFSHLDRLSGLDLEKAMSRMSQDERDRYLRS